MLGWLTPDLADLNERAVVRTVKVPWPLLFFVGGALRLLAEESNWEAHGSASKEVIAGLFTDVYDEWIGGDSMAYIGMIAPFISSNLPEGWLPANGSSWQVADYPELAAVVPAAWVSGSVFTIPDLAARSLVGDGVLSNSYAVGDVGGEEAHQLTVDEIPPHNHTYVPPNLDIDLAAPGVPDIIAASVGVPTQTSDAGGGLAHENMPPYMVVKYGVFSGRT